jgi:hypothetical protein
MKKHIPGMKASPAYDLPQGAFLVEVERAYYSNSAKPFLTLRFRILEPRPVAGKTFGARLYCTPRALWKLEWFLRDFGYDEELLQAEQLDDRSLMGLRGALQVSRQSYNGRTYCQIDGFASADTWERHKEAVRPEAQVR